MLFKLRDNAASGSSSAQEQGDDAAKNDALGAAAAARKALEAMDARDKAKADAARIKKRMQREETQRRGSYGGCVC